MSKTDSLPVIEGEFRDWPDFWFQRLLRSEREGNKAEFEEAIRELERLEYPVKRKWRVR